MLLQMNRDQQKLKSEIEKFPKLKVLSFHPKEKELEDLINSMGEEWDSI